MKMFGIFVSIMLWFVVSLYLLKLFDNIFILLALQCAYLAAKKFVKFEIKYWQLI